MHRLIFPQLSQTLPSSSYSSSITSRYLPFTLLILQNSLLRFDQGLLPGHLWLYVILNWHALLYYTISDCFRLQSCCCVFFRLVHWSVTAFFTVQESHGTLRTDWCGVVHWVRLCLDPLGNFLSVTSLHLHLGCNISSTNGRANVRSWNWYIVVVDLPLRWLVLHHYWGSQKILLVLMSHWSVRQGAVMGTILLVLGQIVENITLMRIKTVSHCQALQPIVILTGSQAIVLHLQKSWLLMITP